MSSASAREEILARVRRAQGSALREPYASIPRGYRQSGTLDLDGRIALFEERLRDYDARVFRSSLAQLPSAIHEAAAARDKHCFLVPPGFARDLLPQGITFESGDGLSFEELDRREGVLTGCALAIAQTGTIVLRHSGGDGRRSLTLIPDYHLCVVYADQIVETVVEGLRAMAKFGAAPITTVSGPSATSDIEMTRIKGVHGPRTLDVIIVGD